jgi:hypothetical protein
VKHLLYEQQNNITTLKSDAELALKLQQDEFSKREAELNRDKRGLKQELKEQVRVAGTPGSSAPCACHDCSDQWVTTAGMLTWHLTRWCCSHKQLHSNRAAG